MLATLALVLRIYQIPPRVVVHLSLRFEYVHIIVLMYFCILHMGMQVLLGVSFAFGQHTRARLVVSKPILWEFVFVPLRKY